MKLSAIPGPQRHTKPLVVIGVLTRNRPDILSRTLDGIRLGMRTTLCDSRLLVWNNGSAPIESQTHGVGHNVGQHISMNRLIDEACRLNADYFIRVDEDCYFETRQWLAKFIRLQQKHMKLHRRPVIIGPHVKGLRNPPPASATIKVGKYNCNISGILGGICRMMPMPVIRYWRFDERSPMGYGEAIQFTQFCMKCLIPMLQLLDVEVSHGESTEKQEKDNPAWSYEHDMLQQVPYGL